MEGDLPAGQVAELDSAVRSALTAAVPGAVVGVQGPQGTWTKAYGKADVKTGAKMSVGTHTRIGSVTKTFTTSVVLRLAQDGKLSLDDTIATYVPGVPNGERITLRQLADMTSGVASYTRSTTFTDRYFAHPETVFTPDELLEVGLAQSPLFEPGTQFDYSNTNTVLLGMVIEKVTGGPVEQAIATYVTEPLHLTQTSWPGTSTALPKPYADGYTLQGTKATPSKPDNATHWNQAWGWTAGELISDVHDLLTFGRAMGTGQGLVDAQSQTTRLTSFPEGGGYGFGFGCIDGWVGHTGELPGYNTTVYYDTRRDTTVVVQVNSDIASGSCEESPTLTDDPRDRVCSSPATRIFVALSTALGHTFHALPAR
jgi:D-alanyl-D-alanine carboxypeptidase